jgi:hypothetical protein
MKVVTASTDKTAILWDAATGSKLQTFQGHASIVFSVALSSDSKTRGHRIRRPDGDFVGSIHREAAPEVSGAHGRCSQRSSLGRRQAGAYRFKRQDRDSLGVGHWQEATDIPGT